jgi:L-fuculose-phosphate aldolase
MSSWTHERERLLSTGRELLEAGLVEGSSGNLSMRLSDGSILMTPSSIPYPEMTPEDLVVVDRSGELLEGTRQPTTERSLHLACLEAHADISAVIHCHPKYATMFALTRQAIPCVIEEFDVYVGGEVRVAAYHLTGSDELAREVARHLADRSAVLMANHGLATVGADPEQAAKVARLVERTAEIVWGARLLGDVVPLPAETLERFAPVYRYLRGRGEGR